MEPGTDARECGLLAQQLSNTSGAWVGRLSERLRETEDGGIY